MKPKKSTEAKGAAYYAAWKNDRDKVDNLISKKVILEYPIFFQIASRTMALPLIIHGVSILMAMAASVPFTTASVA
jgi:hypothetical protein